MRKFRSLLVWIKHRWIRVALVALIIIIISPCIGLLVLIALQFTLGPTSTKRFGTVANVEMGDDWKTFLNKLHTQSRYPVVHGVDSTGRVRGAIDLNEPWDGIDAPEFKVIWFPESPPEYVMGYTFVFKDGVVEKVLVHWRFIETP